MKLLKYIFFVIILIVCIVFIIQLNELNTVDQIAVKIKIPYTGNLDYQISIKSEYKGFIKLKKVLTKEWLLCSI